MNALEADFASKMLAARQRKLGMAELFDSASQLEAASQPLLSAVLYETWLARNKTPHDHLAYFNLGVTLFNAGEIEEARHAYQQAIAISPTFAQAHFNLGLMHERSNDLDGAIAEWSWLIANVPADHAELRSVRLLALNNLARLYENARRYGEALACLDMSLAVQPDQEDVLHHWVFLRARRCEWPVYAPIAGVDPQLVRQSTSAMAMIALSDDPEAQLAAARSFVRKKINLAVPRLSPDRPYGHRRIRVGYLSSDFCLHPVAMLTVGLFELHDRDRFEIYGYCWSREDGSPLRQRVIKAMDHFHRVNELSDEAAARLIREHEIDILVDLHGQTLGARPAIAAHRPAPVQITYLGLPATTGLPFIDYVIADRFLIPEEFAKYYTEKPLYMPDVYQVSDRNRVAAAPPSREQCGLPPAGFVFCCFNNNYKYTPEVFTTWVNILRRTPDSVLWLLSDNPWAEANLRKHAAGLGLDGDRIVFTTRTSPEHYLARYAIADLFLDSFPFNAGTTANDALWMGLPVLTVTGRSFASRMAGALLTAAGLDELITYDLRAYEERAVALAAAPETCRHLREKLREVRESGVLFDTPRFVRNLEKHFQRLVRKPAEPTGARRSLRSLRTTRSEDPFLRP